MAEAMRSGREADVADVHRVERYETVDLVHLSARAEPNNPVLGSCLGALLHFHRGVKVDAVALPSVHLRLIDHEFLHAIFERTWPSRVVADCCQLLLLGARGIGQILRSDEG